MEMFKLTILLFLDFIINIASSEYRSKRYFGFSPATEQDATTTPDPSTLGCGIPPSSCPNTTYRSYDGSCNNLQNPGLGMPQRPLARLLPHNYGDGISSPTKAKSGRDLPLSRKVSLVLFPDVPIKDAKFTLLNMQFGQIITTDMSQGSTHKIQCCTDDGQPLPRSSIPDHCYPLILPDDDPILISSNMKCSNSFYRTITNRDRNCIPRHQPADQLSIVNCYLDLSIIYGNTDEKNRELREFQGGRLRVVQRRGKDWLLQSPNVRKSCPGAQSLDEPCYISGDSRLNQNPQLTLLYIILVREHNRLARSLATLNPAWDDERLFQEARRINIAQYQFITYYEWLPISLGTDNSLKNKIIFNSKNFTDDYNPSVNPSVLNEHSAAAFRFFHALIAGHLDLTTPYRDIVGTLRFSDWINRPSILEQDDNFDHLLRGLTTQAEEESNQYCTREITQFLFRKPGSTFGTDMRALDVQRNRDHGLASYNDYRVFFGLPRANKFKDFSDVISDENIRKLESLYESPDDVDLTVGASLERLVPGTLAGPVFLRILTEQFYRARAGDRFFFENGNKETGFTKAQLKQIRKASMARLFCDNGNNIVGMQTFVFRKVSQDNPVIPCKNIRRPDLSAWKEGEVADVDGGY